MTFPKKAYIVSHTHWDREWYKTFHEFRVDLARVVRKVLDALEEDSEFRHFVLDGQGIVLEDYLAIHPEDTDRVRALVEANKLSLGPWYILPDEFLVSGEATLRNIQIGHRIAAGFGGVQKAGYMPDSFGHIAQVPQILRQCGIDSFVYTRGNGSEIDELGYEYQWEAPDGSTVLAINQCGGYCNAGALGFEEIWHAHTPREVDPDRAVTQVRDLFEKMQPLSRGDLVLLNNGCDHFPPQQEFGKILSALRQTFPDTEFVHTSLEEYVAAVREAGIASGRYQGELRGGRLHHILSGVWSARMPLKQQNDRAQTMLTDALEPTLAYTHFLLGRPYPSGQVNTAWKLLLENHPHDSICGCSTDEVHRDMQPRFRGVIQTAEQLLVHELKHIAPSFARRAAGDRATVVTVFNPLPEARSEVVDRLIVLQPLDYDFDRLVLQDEDGRAVPFEIRSIEYVERFWGIDYRVELDGARQASQFQTYRETFGSRILRGADRRSDSDAFLSIRFLAEDLPALGHSNYFLSERSTPPSVPSRDPQVEVRGNTLDNGIVEVQVHENGSFDIVDKQSGRIHTGLGGLEDSEDIGDEYDYCAAPNGKTWISSSTRGRVRVIDSGPWRGRIEVRFAFELPAAIDPERERRSEETVVCEAVQRITLEAHSRLVDIETRFDNRALDHRLRTRFPSGIRSETLISDAQFVVHERPLEQPNDTDWVQPAPTTFPQQDFSLVEDTAGGLALLNRGLPEIEAVRETDGSVTMALTLLRSVGWLSRDDFESRRKQNAGPTLPTPEAQCLGQHVFRYALMPYEGDWVSAGVKHVARRWRVPVMVIQGVEDQHVAGGVSFLSTSSTRTSISAVKKHDERETLVIRLYNLTGDAERETLHFARPPRRAWNIDGLEERVSQIEVSRDTLSFEVAPHAIFSLEVEFA